MLKFLLFYKDLLYVKFISYSKLLFKFKAEFKQLLLNDKKTIQNLNIDIYTPYLPSMIFFS